MFLDSGDAPEHPDKIHIDKQKTFILWCNNTIHKILTNYPVISCCCNLNDSETQIFTFTVCSLSFVMSSHLELMRDWTAIVLFFCHKWRNWGNSVFAQWRDKQLFGRPRKPQGKLCKTPKNSRKTLKKYLHSVKMTFQLNVVYTNMLIYCIWINRRQQLNYTWVIKNDQKRLSGV